MSFFWDINKHDILLEYWPKYKYLQQKGDTFLYYLLFYFNIIIIIYLFS